MINGVMMNMQEDKPFGPPPEEYNYRCSHCNCEVWVNEAIIDFDLGFAEFEGRSHEGYMPVPGCPGVQSGNLALHRSKKSARRALSSKDRNPHFLFNKSMWYWFRLIPKHYKSISYESTQ